MGEGGGGDAGQGRGQGVSFTFNNGCLKPAAAFVMMFPGRLQTGYLIFAVGVKKRIKEVMNVAALHVEPVRP